MQSRQMIMTLWSIASFAILVNGATESGETTHTENPNNEKVVSPSGQLANQIPGSNSIPNQMSNLPNQMGNLPNQMSNLPNQMGNLPNQMSNLPNQMNQLPNQFNQIPNQMNQLPNQMQNLIPGFSNMNPFGNQMNPNNNMNQMFPNNNSIIGQALNNLLRRGATMMQAVSQVMGNLRNLIPNGQNQMMPNGQYNPGYQMMPNGQQMVPSFH